MTRIVEIEDQTGRSRYLWLARDFAEAHPGLVSSYGALRKQIEHRRKNDLLAMRAVVESRLGCLIDPDQYRAWLVTPATALEQAPGPGDEQKLRSERQ
jgi:hypothetical protein